MAEPVLIDTSAWICALRREGPPKIFQAVDQALADRCAAICEPIRLELVLGTRTTEEYHELILYLDALIPMPVSSEIWPLAEHLGHVMAKARLKCPAVDLLIASTTMHYGCRLLHYDRHFETLAEHSALRLHRM